MSVKIQNGAIEQTLGAMQRFNSNKRTGLLLLNASRIQGALEKAWTEYDTARNSLLDEYGEKDELGNFKTVANMGQQGGRSTILLKAETRSEFRKKEKELNDAYSELNVPHLIGQADLLKLDIEPTIIAPLLPFVLMTDA